MPVTVDRVPIKEVDCFVYLRSVINRQGSTARDLTARIGKPRASFVMLKNICASRKTSIIAAKLQSSIPTSRRSCSIAQKPGKKKNKAYDQNIKNIYIKSAYEPSGPSDWSFSWFQLHEATRSISTPPWMRC